MERGGGIIAIIPRRYDRISLDARFDLIINDTRGEQFQCAGNKKKVKGEKGVL